MPEPMWQPPMAIIIPAIATHGYWTKVLDFVDVSSWLKIWVEDVAKRPPVWSYAEGRTCSADGDALAPINQTSCLLSTAVPGSLIAKVGGSRGGRVDDGHAVVVGSFCVFKTDDKSSGALYLAMNFDPSRPLERAGEISVCVAVPK